MSAVLLAVFQEYATAERVHLDLFRDGFPTDRLDLTACCDMGRAGLGPAQSPHDKFLQYFRTLFCREDERDCAEKLVESVESGAATVTVLPRGPIETARATEILAGAGATQIVQHDLAKQAWEHAAARGARAWISNFWVERDPDCHCIYCRIFEGGSKSLARDNRNDQPSGPEPI